MTVEVGFAITVILFMISCGNFWLSRKAAVQNETKELDENAFSIRESLIKTNVKLDNICATMTELRTDIKNMNRELQDMDKRVTVVEQNLKTIWRKVDELKEKAEE